MNTLIAEPNITLDIALVFGLIIGLYGAVLGVMGSLDYFYINRSRYSILKITALSSILFSFIITIIGVVSLSLEEYSSLWYATTLPGLLGLIIFSALFVVISKRNKQTVFNNYQRDLLYDGFN
jgi:uncharacterized membrane protein YfcA